MKLNDLANTENLPDNNFYDFIAEKNHTLYRSLVSSFPVNGISVSISASWISQILQFHKYHKSAVFFIYVFIIIIFSSANTENLKRIVIPFTVYSHLVWFHQTSHPL